MTAEELEAHLGKFDREFIESEAQPLTPALKKKLQKARRKRGRPRVGKGAKRVLVTIEMDLLRRVDSFRRKQKMSRAQLIAEGLEMVLSGSGPSAARSWGRRATGTCRRP